MNLAVEQQISSGSAPQPSTFTHSPCQSAAAAGQPPTPLPFYPANNESHKAFESFLSYFDLGVNRSFPKVARAMRVNLSTVKVWASRFDWRGRVRAYNTHLLQTRVLAETAARRDQALLWSQRTARFKEREWAAAEKLLAAAQRVLDSFDSRDPADVSLAEVSKALDIASKIGRLATGLATEKTEHTGAGGGPIRVEVEAALKKIYGQPLPGEVVDVHAEPVQPALADAPAEVRHD